MMQNNSSPKKIEEVLNILDGIQRAEPQPFFYTRLKARMEAAHFSIWDTVSNRVSSLISKPLIAVAGVFLVLVLNLFAIYSHTMSTNNNDQSDVVTTEEYSVVSNPFYDIENNKP